MTKWQQRYMILFENHVDIKTGEIFDHYFKRDVEHIRGLMHEVRPMVQPANDKPMFITSMVDLALRYKFPMNMVNFLKKFIYTGEIDPSLINSYIRIIDGRSETLTEDEEPSHELWKRYQESVARSSKTLQSELKIVIGDEVTREQLRDYITDHWDAIEAGIKAKPKGHERSIIRPHLNAKRDYRVLVLLESGLTYDEVALQIQKEYPGYAPTYMAIQKIKSKVKSLRNTRF